MIRRTPESKSKAESPVTREPALQAKIDEALASAQPVKIPRTLSNPHPLIRNWIDEDRLARERARGSIYSVVPLSVTRTETDRRRLRILSGLFREFERIGFSVTAERQRGRTITIRSNSASMNFVLYEPYKRARIPLTEREKKDSWNQGRDWKYENQPTRELQLRIESYLLTGERTVWRDKAETRLEDRVDEILEGLLTAMAVIEDNEQKRREEEQRRWKLEQERAEHERQRKIEAKHWKHLVDLAEAARQARMVREFLDELEQRAVSTADDQGLTAKLQDWFASARKRADAFDPILPSPESYASEQISHETFNDWDRSDARRFNRIF